MGYEVIVRTTLEHVQVELKLEPGTNEHLLKIGDMEYPITEQDIANLGAACKNAYNILDGGLE